MADAELEIRVRYAETDQMGVAHHASYLVWFEAARTELIRSRGRSYAQIEADGWLLVVVEARCRYARPARYDDVLTIRTRVGALGRATLAFEYEVRRNADDTVLARGTTVHAAVDRTGRARRIPEEIRRLLGGPNARPVPVRRAAGEESRANRRTRGSRPTGRAGSRPTREG